MAMEEMKSLEQCIVKIMILVCSHLMKLIMAFIFGIHFQLQKIIAIIIPKTDVAALAGKSNAELWPIVKGDLNQDGKDELYTGGGTGLNLVAIQYNGSGSLLDKS